MNVDGPHGQGERTTEMAKRKSSWRRILWDSWDKPVEVYRPLFHNWALLIFEQERKLILKMDLTLMTFGCLGTFIKYLDKYDLSPTTNL